MTEFSAQVLALAERIDGLRAELQQLAAQAESLTAARAADQAACTLPEPHAQRSTASPESRSHCPPGNNDNVSAERVISLILIQQAVSMS